MTECVLGYVVLMASVWPLAARERNGGGAEEGVERRRSGVSRAKGQTEAPRPCAPPLQPVTSARGARWSGPERDERRHGHRPERALVTAVQTRMLER